MRNWHDYKKTMLTPETLGQAAQTNDLLALARLLEAGAAINEKDARGYSPLMLAVYAGNREAAEMLLRRGADPQATDLGGNSILMGAAFKGHLDLVRRLLQAGVDVEARNHAGLTALDFANTFGRVEVAEFLKALSQKQEPVNRVVGFFKILMGRIRKSSVPTAGLR
jgi:hypothetical protein